MCSNTACSKEEAAKSYYAQGCNCAQAVFLAFAEELGLSADVAGKIALPYGGGMGRGETCGALTGALMALGLAQNASVPPAPEEKNAACAKAKTLANDFQETFGTTLCREILALPEGKGKKLCPALVGFMAARLESMLKEDNQ